MTEIALNERIAELQENDSETAHQRQKDWHRLRRVTGIRKADKSFTSEMAFNMSEVFLRNTLRINIVSCTLLGFF